MNTINITKNFFLNNFMGTLAHSQFPQSWEWGELQENTGNKVFRIGIEDEGEIIAAATLIRKAMPAGRSYLYCPRGPVINFEFRISNFETISNDKISKYYKVLDLLLDEISQIAEEEKAIFLRLEPSFKIQNLKFKIARTLDVQPSKTLILDLTKTEDELLKDMHQKTRYNIRLAEKKGVTIREGAKEDFEIFWKLIGETHGRDGFRVHNKDYYGRMIKIGCMDNDLPEANSQINSKLHAKLFLAEYDRQAITANIVGFFGDTATYMHGASSNEHRNVMAPFLLQWEVIRMAKNLSYKYYDFYGVDENKWPGVTRFKKGFGGLKKEYPGTFDLIFNNKWYNIYRFIRKIRRVF